MLTRKGSISIRTARIFSFDTRVADYIIDRSVLLIPNTGLAGSSGLAFRADCHVVSIVRVVVCCHVQHLSWFQ